jgi:hypothetical protein
MCVWHVKCKYRVLSVRVCVCGVYVVSMAVERTKIETEEQVYVRCVSSALGACACSARRSIC